MIQIKETMGIAPAIPAERHSVIGIPVDQSIFTAISGGCSFSGRWK
jgi:hypothetical protein